MPCRLACIDQALLMPHCASACMRQLRVGSRTYLDTILLTQSTALAPRSLGSRLRMFLGRSGKMSPMEKSCSPTATSGSAGAAAGAARADDDDDGAAAPTRACSCPPPVVAGAKRGVVAAATSRGGYASDAARTREQSEDEHGRRRREILAGCHRRRSAKHSSFSCCSRTRLGSYQLSSSLHVISRGCSIYSSS
jgi:hypothetical protein